MGGVEGGEGGAARSGRVGETTEGGSRRGVALEVQHGSLCQGHDTGYRSRAGHRQGREGSKDQVGTTGAGLDEGGSEREDCLGSKGSVKGRGGGGNSRGNADEGLMSSLDGEDRSSSAEDLGVGNKGSGTQVGRDTNALKDSSSGNHTLGVSEAEVVLAGLDRLDTSLSDGAL